MAMMKHRTKRRTKAQREAALLFADWIETIPDEDWDFSCLWQNEDDSSECGTVGCAMGHGLIHGMVPGFSVIYRQDSYIPINEKTNETVCFLDAAKQAFGLSLDEAAKIFADGTLSLRDPITQPKISRKLRDAVRKRS